jgi:predicted Rossmann fold nucleotide-binding protein DprA/Smf involved in DNA uptake
VRVAIVGSREHTNEKQVRAYVRTLEPGTVVVSGGAKGVDSWAVGEAEKLGLETVVFHPDRKAHKHRAALMRNHLIVRHADRVVAFWDGKSTGTMYTVRIARAAGKPVEVFRS